MAGFSSPAYYALYGGVVDKSSPTLADLTGDGVPEVIVGTTAFNGDTGRYDRPTRLEALEGTGEYRFSAGVGAPINSAPAVGDINGDGHPEVVVTLGGDPADINQPGGLIAFDRFGSTNMGFFPTYEVDGDGIPEGVYSSPTLCDLDHDEDMEVIFGAWDQRIYVLDYRNGDFVSLWNNIPGSYEGRGFLSGDSIWSTAACVDLNRDGEKEIVIGGDITAGGGLPDGSQSADGGYLYIFDKDGNLLVRRFMSEAVYAAPAVGDLDGDGDYEIVSGTSWYWWNVHGRTDQPYVYVFDTSSAFDTSIHYADPAKLPHMPGWPRPTTYPGFSSAALADLDGDDDLEVVIGTGHPDANNDGILGAGSVYAWHHTGQVVAGWPVYPKNWDNNDGPIFSSPTIADIDADGAPEVLFSMLWDVYIYNGDGSMQNRLETMYNTWGSPAVGDTDGDGRPEVWVGGSHVNNASRGYLWSWELNTVAEIDQPWPMFHRTPRNTRYYVREPQLKTSTTSLLLMHQVGSGDSESATFSIRNGGEGEITWTVTGTPDNVIVSPGSGTVGWAELTIELTVSTAGYAEGTHQLGDLQIEGTINETTVDGSPLSIPITLYVGDVHRVFLPLVNRGSR